MLKNIITEGVCWGLRFRFFYLVDVDTSSISGEFTSREYFVDVERIVDVVLQTQSSSSDICRRPRWTCGLHGGSTRLFLKGGNTGGTGGTGNAGSTGGTGDTDGTGNTGNTGGTGGGSGGTEIVPNHTELEVSAMVPVH